MAIREYTEEDKNAGLQPVKKPIELMQPVPVNKPEQIPSITLESIENYIKEKQDAIAGLPTGLDKPTGNPTGLQTEALPELQEQAIPIQPMQEVQQELEPEQLSIREHIETATPIHQALEPLYKHHAVLINCILWFIIFCLGILAGTMLNLTMQTSDPFYSVKNNLV